MQDIRPVRKWTFDVQFSVWIQTTRIQYASETLRYLAFQGVSELQLALRHCLLDVGCRAVQPEIAKLLLGNICTRYCRNWTELHMILEN